MDFSYQKFLLAFSLLGYDDMVEGTLRNNKLTDEFIEKVNSAISKAEDATGGEVWQICLLFGALIQY